MAATDQPYRSQRILDMVFAVTCIAMLLSLVWMFVQDFNREFKTVQREFRDVEAAMNEPDRALRSRDAIHLATARILGPDLDGLVTYDNRLTAAASDAGLVTLSPQD